MEKVRNLKGIDLTRMECKAKERFEIVKREVSIDLTRMECKVFKVFKINKFYLEYRFNQNGM